MDKDKRQNIAIIIGGLCIAFCIIFFLVKTFGEGNSSSAKSSKYNKSVDNTNDNIPPLDDQVTSTIKPNEKKDTKEDKDKEKKDDKDKPSKKENKTNKESDNNSNRSSNSSNSNKSNTTSNDHPASDTSDPSNKVTDGFTKRY